MKALDLQHGLLNVFHSRITLRNPISLRPNLAGLKAKLVNTDWKSINTKVVGAITEGLKQNLFGNDINIEFVVLTLQALGYSAIKTLKKADHADTRSLCS